MVARSTWRSSRESLFGHRTVSLHSLWNRAYVLRLDHPSLIYCKMSVTEGQGLYVIQALNDAFMWPKSKF